MSGHMHFGVAALENDCTLCASIQSLSSRVAETKGYVYPALVGEGLHQIVHCGACRVQII